MKVTAPYQGPGWKDSRGFPRWILRDQPLLLLAAFRGPLLQPVAAAACCGFFLGRGVEMPGRAGDALGDGGLAIGDDAVADRLDVQPQPVPGLLPSRVVGRAVVVDAAHGAQAGRSARIRRSGRGCRRRRPCRRLSSRRRNSGRRSDRRRCRSCSGTECGGPPARCWRSRRWRVLVRALVDLEQRAGLRGVVDHHADLRDLGLGPVISSSFCFRKPGCSGFSMNSQPQIAVHVGPRWRCPGSSRRGRCSRCSARAAFVLLVFRAFAAPSGSC
jgi:hypothetical protein